MLISFPDPSPAPAKHFFFVGAGGGSGNETSKMLVVISSRISLIEHTYVCTDLTIVQVHVRASFQACAWYSYQKDNTLRRLLCIKFARSEWKFISLLTVMNTLRCSTLQLFFLVGVSVQLTSDVLVFWALWMCYTFFMFLVWSASITLQQDLRNQHIYHHAAC